MFCIEHFSEDDFIRNDKHKVSLKPDSIPTIFNQIIQVENGSCPNYNQNEHIDIVESVGHCGSYLQEDCCQCLQKDQKIASLTEKNKKVSQINQQHMKTFDDLRKKIKSIRDKSYYLESTNGGQQLLNEKLSQALQVIFHKTAHRTIQRILHYYYYLFFIG